MNLNSNSTNQKKNSRKPPKTISELYFQNIEKMESINIRLVKVLLYTGLRVSEVPSFFKYLYMFSKISSSIAIVTGKGNKERYVFVSPRIQKDIHYILNNKLTVIDCSRWTIYRMVKEAGKELGYPSLHPHQCRHTFATRLLNKYRVPIKHIQVLLGHSDIRTTGNIYLHPDTQTLQESINSLVFGVV